MYRVFSCEEWEDNASFGDLIDDLVSATSNSDPVTTNYTFFTPPSWIQGVWKRTDGITNKKCIEFTTDDYLKSENFCDAGPRYSWNITLNKGSWTKEYEIVKDSIYELVFESFGYRDEQIFTLKNDGKLHFFKKYGKKAEWNNAWVNEYTFEKF